MDDKVFPEIDENTVWHGQVGYANRCILHDKPLLRYLTQKIDGWSVKNFLETEKINKYALYAVTDFTKLFLNDIRKNKGRNPVVICDKNAEVYRNYIGFKVVPIDELDLLYQEGKINKIIIMSILHENEIIDELLQKGIQLCDLITIASVIYSES